MYTATSKNKPERRYDLDWLRVLAFGLLIFYHTGMLYVEHWGFHYKSQYLSASLEYLMLLSSPWRMLLIWFISGYALGATLQYLTGWQQFTYFAVRRTVLLLLPLMTGLWLVVPPQLYAEMLQNDGLLISYWQFYRAFIDLQHPLFADYQRGVWPHVDVNHLWYLRSLWQFTLLILLLLPVLCSNTVQRGSRCLLQLALPWQLLLLIILLLTIHAFTAGDSSRELAGLCFLLFGLLAGRQPVFWQRLGEAARWLGILCMVNYLLLSGCYFISLQEGLTGPAQRLSQQLLYLSYATQAVAVTFWLLALAQRYLNKPHRYLSQANRAIFPIYVVHQSFIIVAALYLTPFAVGGATEAALVLVLTATGCCCLSLLLLKLPLLAPFFGMQPDKYYSAPWRIAGLTVGLLIVMPLAVKLLL